MVSTMLGLRRGNRVLELDGSAGGHGGSSQQRRDMPRPTGQQSARCGDAPAADSACCCARPSAGAEQIGKQPRRPESGHHRGKLPAHATHLAPELPAARAVPQVPSRRPVGAHTSIMGERELLSDLRAGRVACVHRLCEPDPRADEQRLHGRDRDDERVGHLRITHPAELTQQQRRALLLGQPAHVVDQATQRLTLLGLGDWIVNR
jgi:hypothetical protein